MRMHLYCETCHRIKLGRVTNAGMIRMARNQPIWGQCSDCEDREREAARERHPSRRGR